MTPRRVTDVMQLIVLVVHVHDVQPTFPMDNQSVPGEMRVKLSVLDASDNGRS